MILDCASDDGDLVSPLKSHDWTIWDLNIATVALLFSDHMKMKPVNNSGLFVTLAVLSSCHVDSASCYTASEWKFNSHKSGKNGLMWLMIRNISTIVVCYHGPHPQVSDLSFQQQGNPDLWNARTSNELQHGNNLNIVTEILIMLNIDLRKLMRQRTYFWHSSNTLIWLTDSWWSSPPHVSVSSTSASTTYRVLSEALTFLITLDWC